MPVYPGTKPPVFNQGASIDDDGFLEKKITLTSHVGTHIDAPAHIIKGAKTLDQFGIEHFMGNAARLDLFQNKQLITMDDLVIYQDLIKRSEFLLFRTGWSRLWGTRGYFFDYPVLSDEAARWLSLFDLKGLGFDTASVDPVDSMDLQNHNIFLRNNRLIIENLTNLDAVTGQHFMFSCLPLKIEQADGSPVRAIAVIQ